MTINVGDRVTWQERTTTRPYLHSETGEVVELYDDAAPMLPPVAIVQCDGGKRFMAVKKLQRVGAIEAVADVEDYYQLKVIGDLGGVELA